MVLSLWFVYVSCWKYFASKIMLTITEGVFNSLVQAILTMVNVEGLLIYLSNISVSPLRPRIVISHLILSI